MPNKLEERDWAILLNRIKEGRCTPFLGAGASFGALPLGPDLARELAREYGYPLEDSSDLPKVAQFLAVEYDLEFPKEQIVRRLKDATPPDFEEPDEPHGILADLPLPVYMTTNYDSFMVWALERRHRDPKRELCKWTPLLKDFPSIFDRQPDFSPTAANPLVFHLHGHDEVPESLVLTEDDYLHFLTEISSRQKDLLPSPVIQALGADTLLFIGYSLNDWDFRVLVESLRAGRRRSIAVLLPPTGSEAESGKAQEYLTKYYEQIEGIRLRVYWGTAREFSAELRRHWQAYQ